MTTTFYDRRAERAVAGAVAEQHRADAAARRAEAELRVVEVEAARADLADRREQAAADRRQAERAQRAADRARRWSQVRTGIAAAARGVGRLVPVLAGGIAMGAPILIGWTGQLDTARTVLHLGLLAWVFPAAIEGGAWWLAFLQHRAIARGVPTGRLRLWTWVLAGLAAAMNVWRGTLAYGPVGGVALGLASLLGIGLWEITAWYLRWSASGRTAGQARLALARWARFPRLSLSAWSIALARGADSDREQAWRAAWIDRFGVGPDACRRDRKLARLITKAAWQADSEAARRGDLIIVNGVILRPLPTNLPAPETSVPTGETETTSTPIDQDKLSPLASALLIKVRAAIEAGELPETPSANKITSRFGGAQSAAMEVRDHLRALRASTEREAA